MPAQTIIPSFPERASLLQKIKLPDKWDILVIGGGATGLGIALEATARGYKTLLVEQADFAKGTSSRSTKLVHGGVRYLAQGNIRLVREACIERGLLHRNAPHLVKDQLFIVPVYTFWDRLKYTIGLKLYDRIAGKLSLGSSVFLPAKETIRRLPGIRSKGLKGGICYHDGQFDDARLAINLVQSILEKGGCAINYLQVAGLLKDREEKIAGAILRDTETGDSFSLQAAAVVNATGVFVEQILQMDQPGSQKTIRVSQGIHLVLDKSFYPSADALMIPRTSDGRVLFAVPWHDKVVVGTTDTPVEQASLEPVALEKEIAFILETAGNYLEKKPVRADVLSVFAGQRPLAAPANGLQKTKEISRSHKITVSSSRLLTMLGGKWTTYRKMGEDMVDRIEKLMDWPSRLSVTRSLKIHGYASDMPATKDAFSFYGNDATFIRQSVHNGEGEWISEKLRIHSAQVIWAVNNEMARTLEDVLARRTRALFLDAREAQRIAPQVAALMAAALGRDQHWEEEQLKKFETLSQRYILD